MVLLGGIPRSLAIASLAIVASLVATAGAAAATVTVTTTADRDNGVCNVGDCSLREAVKYAATDSTIVVPAGAYTLSAGQLDVTRNLTISGAGARSTAVDGGGASRVFQVENGVTATISGIKITGGAADVGGGIKVFGVLTLEADTLTGNTATVSGGAIDTNGTVTVSDSTIAGNTTTGPGYSIGAGIDCFCTTVSVTNSTIAGNTSSGGSSDQGGGILYSSGNPMTLLNATIAGNTAGSGAGVYAAGAVNATNTIVSGNAGGDCNTALTSLGHNLSGDHSCGFTAAGDHQDSDPLLGALQDNGGQTDTRALGAGSPAIDAGDPAACPATDQRGIARQGSACDIGAFEFVPPAQTTPPPTTTTQTTPPPPAPPHCSLRPLTRKVGVRSSKHALAPGRLYLVASCDQNVTLKLRGRVTVKPRRGVKGKTRRYAFHALSTSFLAAPGRLTLRLPAAAFRGLKLRRRLSANLTLTFSDAQGSGTATLSIPTLPSGTPGTGAGSPPDACTVFSASLASQIAGANLSKLSGQTANGVSVCVYGDTSGGAAGATATVESLPKVPLTQALQAALGQQAGSGTTEALSGLGDAAIKNVQSHGATIAFAKDSVLVVLSVSSGTRDGTAIESDLEGLARQLVSVM